MKRERLTKDQIKRDLAKRIKRTILDAISGLVVGLVLMGVFGYLQFDARDQVNPPIYSVLLFCFIGTCIVYTVLMIQAFILLRGALRERKICQRGEFVVVKDTPVRALSNYQYRKTLKGRAFWAYYILGIHQGQDMIRFSRYGEYWEPHPNRPQLSNGYLMSLYREDGTSLGEADYYLVIGKHDERQTPLMVYHSNVYEYENDVDALFSDEELS